MSKIENFNCEGLCQQEFCGEKYTHVFWANIEGFRVCILLCEQHYNELLNKLLNNLEIETEPTKQLGFSIGKFAKPNNLIEVDN